MKSAPVLMLIVIWTAALSSCSQQPMKMDVGLSQYVFTRPQLEKLAAVSRKPANFRPKTVEGQPSQPVFHQQLELALRFVEGALQAKPSEMDHGTEQIFIQIQARLREISQNLPHGPSPEIARTMALILDESKSFPNASDD